MNRRGFTLIELIVALTLMTAVGAAVYSLLLNNQRVYRRQTEQVDMNATIRTAITLLPGDVRELNAADPFGSDIIVMTDTMLEYKASRGVFFLCRQPAVGINTLVLWRRDSLAFSLEGGLSPTRDTLFIFAENDSTIRGDNQWIHAPIVTVQAGTNNCPDRSTGLPTGAPSISVNVAGGVSLAGVQKGAPVRSVQTIRMKVYPDARGDWWLGAQRYESSNWTGIQPIVGPLANAENGLRLTYFDKSGAVTATPNQVARVAVEVVGRSRGAVVTLTGFGYATEGLATQVALRNNPRF